MIALLLPLLFGQLTPAPTPSLEDTVALGHFLDGVMNEQLIHLKMPGAVVVVVKGDRVLYAGGYGYADLEKRIPIDPATSMFQIGSTGKLFTWTAVMQLVERGRLDLDRDVNAYLKTFQIPSTFAEPITLRHLLTHTAGFQEGVIGYFIGEDSTAIRSIEETLREHVPVRVRPPGRLAAYSNYGASLAGLIVEQVSGIPFAEFIERNIYEPLGIRYATFREPVPADLRSRIVVRYEPVDGRFVARPPEINGGFVPSGGTFMSGLEIAKFLSAHLGRGEYDGRRILRPETADLMHETAFNHDPRIPGMALGFVESRINGRRVIGHSGDSYNIHVTALLLPEENVGIFLGYSGDEGVTARESAAKAFFDRYFPAPAEAAAPRAAPAVDLARYTGAYRTVRRNYTDIDKVLYFFVVPDIEVTVDGAQLRLSGTGAPGSTPFRLEPVDHHLFRQVDGELEVAFREENGKITGIFFEPTAGTERAPWHERVAFWYPTLGIALALFATVLLGSFYRRREIALQTADERRAVRLSTVTALWLIATLVLCALVVAIYQASILQHVPAPLKAVLVMPVVFVGLTLALVVTAIQAWRRGYWGVGRRIHYSLVALAAVAVSAFFAITNVLGWQLG